LLRRKAWRWCAPVVGHFWKLIDTQDRLRAAYSTQWGALLTAQSLPVPAGVRRPLRTNPDRAYSHGVVWRCVIAIRALKYLRCPSLYGAIHSGSEMITIAVVNTKGGVGKTTLSAALAIRAAADGKRVAIVDMDPQKALIAWWRRRGPNQSDSPQLFDGPDTAYDAVEAAQLDGWDHCHPRWASGIPHRDAQYLRCDRAAHTPRSGKTPADSWSLAIREWCWLRSGWGLTLGPFGQYLSKCYSINPRPST